MFGATDERMAEAIELSSDIVIFVSKAYKESPNSQSAQCAIDKHKQQS
jgi:hypothetical protein